MIKILFAEATARLGFCLIIPLLAAGLSGCSGLSESDQVAAKEFTEKKLQEQLKSLAGPDSKLIAPQWYKESLEGNCTYWYKKSIRIDRIMHNVVYDENGVVGAIRIHSTQAWSLFRFCLLWYPICMLTAIFVNYRQFESFHTGHVGKFLELMGGAFVWVLVVVPLLSWGFTQLLNAVLPIIYGNDAFTRIDLIAFFINGFFIVFFPVVLFYTYSANLQKAFSFPKRPKRILNFVPRFAAWCLLQTIGSFFGGEVLKVIFAIAGSPLLFPRDLED